MTVMTDEDEIDWSITTWEGSRREQVRRWRQLSVRQRLEALDEMTELAEQLANVPAQKVGKYGQQER